LDTFLFLLVYRVVSTPLFVAKDEHHHHRREEEKEKEKEEESKSRLLIPTHSEKRER
tara:strand:+ start:383 stop:553 length:171 start_codon:yes stop_codon:yes gene_type:complete